MFTRMMLLGLLAVSLAACQFGSGGSSVTLNLDEADVNTAIQTILAQTGNPLLRDPQVDLQAGKVVINGTHERRDGGGSVSGSIELTFSVQDGALVPTISAVNIEGFDLSDERIAAFNQRLVAFFAEKTTREARRATLTEVSITDSKFSLTLVFNK